MHSPAVIRSTRATATERRTTSTDVRVRADGAGAASPPSHESDYSEAEDMRARSSDDAHPRGCQDTDTR